VAKPYAEAAARNAAPILGVLRYELQGCASLFEIGSGTGQHAVTFAAALPELTWQTSDLEPSHAGIRAWTADAGLDNVLVPISFDVLSAETGGRRYDAVYSANTAHIMSYAAVCRMFELVGTMLNEPGMFCLYGPFSRGGAFSTPSNEAFDTSLRARNSAMGIRDLDDLELLAGKNGMKLARVYAMPANNLLLVWAREEF
jgi:cyclopropane fatty-acyl-phospholipid synthase-like methyltransferase